MRKVELDLKFLEQYLNGHSPVTLEAKRPDGQMSNQERWANNIKPYVHQLKCDAYGNTWGILNPDAPFTVVLEAHADEISWRVRHITNEGFMYLDRNGGSDNAVSGGKRGFIHTKKGLLPVIFTSPAIHLRTGRDTKDEFRITSDKVIADAGMSKKQLERAGVKIGSIITHEGRFEKLGNFITARALDNRAGGFVLAEVAKYLQKSKIKIPYRIIFLNAVQEETGLKGSGMFAKRFGGEINTAICFDVCHSTKGYPYIVSPTTHGEYEMGKGPVMMHSTIMHGGLLELIEKAATENKIPFQLESGGNTSGTDTDQFHAEGIPAALISFALENMHTQVEKMSPKDLVYAVQLTVATLKKLAFEKNRDFVPLKFK